MRIGMVCPYSFDVPGGVQSHVLQLAEVMHGSGHDVSVLAPTSSDAHASLPGYVVSGGRAVPIPYNGSVARLRFGPATHRMVKRWLADGEFDVLHLHEPNAPSLSMLALNIAEGPIVATFHTSTTKSLTLSVFEPILRPMHEKRACQSSGFGSQAITAIGSGRSLALSASISRNGVSFLAMSTWLTIASACTPLSVRPAPFVMRLPEAAGKRGGLGRGPPSPRSRAPPSAARGAPRSSRGNVAGMPPRDEVVYLRPGWW